MASQVLPVAPAPQKTEDYLDHIRDFAPLIEGAGDRIENDRRLPPDVLEALHEARLFRLLLPRQYGGGEVDPPSFFRIISAVAQLDASTAWCLCQGNGCTMAAAYIDPETANAIWGRDPAAVLAWGPGKATATPEGDGYRVTGSWSFASGMRHANWLGGHSVVTEADGTPRMGANGKPVIRTMLIPAEKTTITDIWNVIGLRGTASDAFAVDNLFVPETYTVARDTPEERRCDMPLYQFSSSNLYATGFSGVAQGIARTMLESFRTLAGGKTPRNARHALRDNAVIQDEVARSEARLGAARAYLLSEVTGIWEDVAKGGPLTDDHRSRLRLATTYGIHEAKAVGDTVYDAAGATAIFTSSPFERRFRDLHTVTQQIQGRKDHFQAVGAYMLGHPLELASG